MFNPYNMQTNSGQQATGFYQPIQPQQQPQQQQQQPVSPFGQPGQQNLGFSGSHQNLNSFSNQSQSLPQQMSDFNGNNGTQLNPMSMGQVKGNYYTGQNTAVTGAGFDSKTNQTNTQPSFSSSSNFQGQAQPLQAQGTGFYNVPFQQPQIQFGQQQQQLQQQLQQQQQQQQQQQPQYGQTSVQPQYQQAGFQPQSLTQQRTGPTPNSQQLQHQATGPQVLQLQQQKTGPQSQFLQPQSTGYGQSQALLPQQTGFYTQSQQQAPLEPLRPNATGFVNSFANNGINNDVKIPARRLSFITVNDQAKFERLFRSRVPQGSNTISGNDCRAILMKSGLQPSQLARIWALCDTSKAGELLFPEFALAMHLVNSVLQGDSIPFELQSKTKNEVSSFIDAINLSIASESQTDLSQARTPFDQYLSTNTTGLQNQSTGNIPQTSFGFPLQSQVTGSGPLNPQYTGTLPQISFGIPTQTTGGMQLNQQMTGGMPMQTTGGMQLSQQTTGGMQLNQELTGGRLQPQNTGFMPQTSFNAPMQSQATANGLLQPQTTGSFAPSQLNQSYNSIAPQTTGGFSNVPISQGLQTNNAPAMNLAGGPVVSQQATNPLPVQLTGGPITNLTSQSTSSIPMQQPALTAPPSSGAMPSFGNGIAPQNQPYGGLASQSTDNIVSLQSQPTGYLPPSGFNPSMPLTAQKTGFGNNEIYSQNNFGSDFHAENPDSITAEEKSLFYKIFETYDTNNKGLLDSSSAVEIFRKSGLNRNDLEHIWNLCDVNNSGQLNKQEFALGMHLVYRKLNGFQLPNRLPLGLIPSSTKIIDNLKNQLKSVPNKENKQKTKIDALSYKNNDDDALPSFRNRRKVFKDNNNNSVPPKKNVEPETDLKTEKINTLRKAIKEKRALLESLRAQEGSASEQDELRRVEVLKSQLENLPHFSNVENDAVPIELKNRFDDILSKLPQIFSRITEVDNEISKAKVRLFKLKNPSSLTGTGKNGEITEEDRRKAKSKAILKARMDALTGKQGEPIESLEEEERKYNSAIGRIQDESSKNQHIIDDIRHSISEISASLKSTMNGGVIYGNPADFGKWEFGLGLQPEVQNFIDGLNARKIVSHTQHPSAGAQSAGVNREDYQGDRAASFIQARPTEGQRPSNDPDIFADEEDEEEKQLREELAKLKLKKKTEKERRLAELRKQVEEARADSEEEEKELAPAGNPTKLTTTVAGNTSQAPTPKMYNTLNAAPEHSSALTEASPSTPSSSAPANGRNPFFKQKDPSSSSFDPKAAETQRRLQRGLDDDDDDDDGWSDEETQTTAVPPSTADEQTYAAKEAPAEVQPVAGSAASSVPIAPPLPSLASNAQAPSNFGKGSSEAVPVAPPLPNVAAAATAPPVPVAPPLPDVAVAASAPPVPIAPPLPQINSGSGFSIPPPPPLPGQPVASADYSQPPVNDDEEQDSDDVLSIPDSVPSVEGNDSLPAGIPPPPPLP